LYHIYPRRAIRKAKKRRSSTVFIDIAASFFPEYFRAYFTLLQNEGHLAEALLVTRQTLERMILEHLSAQKPENL